ncbi:MAG: hypothetical protein RID91_02305 [Azospirillaceae bacterium]
MAARVLETIVDLLKGGTTERMLTIGAAIAGIGTVAAVITVLTPMLLPMQVVEVALAVLLAANALGAAVVAIASLQLRRYRSGGPYRKPLGPLAAFGAAKSVALGNALALFVHAETPVTARLVRFGAEKEVVADRVLDLAATPRSAVFDRRRGYDWPETARVATDGLRPGLHAVELASTTDPGRRWAVPMIVKPRTAPDVAVVLSTNTWEAYNTYGGLSNYENFHLFRALHWIIRHTHALPRYYWPTLTDRRPNDIVSEELLSCETPDADHHSRLIGAEWPVLAYLERQGVDYGVYSDDDLVRDPTLAQARLLILAGHAEYWTGEMAYALERYVASGGHVVIAAGNPLFRRVDRIPGGLIVDPLPPSEEAVTRLIGTFYTDNGKFTSAPLTVDRPDHWIFAGAEVEADQVIGARSGFRPWQDDRRHEDGASGVFTQKVGFGSGAFEILATGLNEEGPAHVVFRETEAGGWIFNASAAAFSCCLDRDPVIARMMDNLLESALHSERAAPRPATRLVG